MIRLFKLRWSFALANSLTALAAVAMLASGLSAADGVQQPAARSAASKYAAKQVRLPQEAPRSTSQVRQAGHYETSGAMVRPVRSRQSPAYRTSNLRSAVGDHSVMVQEGEVIMDGSVMSEALPPPEGEMVMDEGAAMHHSGYPEGLEFGDQYTGGCQGGMCDDHCGIGGCGPRGCGPRGCNTNCCLIPCPNFRFDRFEFFAGADAFNNTLNRGEGSSFGFHEGFNWGSPLPCSDLFSMQLGAQAIQSSFSGNDITDDDRRQFFVTGGFFRRVDCGLQGGVVVDFRHDEWYHDPIDLQQIRAELSWMFPCDHEIGVWATHGINNSTSDAEVETTPGAMTMLANEGWNSTDLYAFFYRRHFGCNAYGRVFGGFTDGSDGLVGADFNVPLCENLAVRSDFTYLIPPEGTSNTGNVDESWNVSIGIVWYPGCRTARNKDYNRPLFNVANNGTFFIDRD